MRRILEICPGAVFFGVAGPRMQALGCSAIDDLTGRAAMLLRAVRLAGHCYRLVRHLRRALRADPPDLAILVDSPALHLPMARAIKSAGSPVLYYIAPQLWAWAPWRIGRVRRRVDRLAVILPFEEAYFRDRGVPAEFVGHPLVAQLDEAPCDEDAVRAFRGLGQPVVTCLPGSREHVVREVLPGQVVVARRIAERYPRAVFLFAAASESAAEMIRSGLAGESLNHRVEIGRNTECLRATGLALCASGTATLEVALHRVPMVIMYNGSKWGYRLIGRWLIRTPHLSLVNILAGRRIVPEFMPYYTSTAPIAAEALDLLANEGRREAMRAELDVVRELLGTSRAAGRTAEIAMEMLCGAGPR
jgi:lipid-A-disaccharide synthase